MLLVFIATAPLAAADVPDALAHPRAQQFVRGDANMDGRVTLADVYSILRYLHKGERLRCADAADTDDSGTIGSSDFALILQMLFSRHNSVPAAPYPEVGVDPTLDGLDCRLGHVARPPDVHVAGIAGVDVEEGCLCPRNFGAGVGVEYIHFRGTHCDTVYVAPGERVRVPIVLQTGGGIEGLTLSLRAEPEKVFIHGIDYFSDTYLEETGMRSYYSRSSGEPGEEFFASTLMLNSVFGVASIPELLEDEVIAQLTLSISPDAEPGTTTLVTFEEMPAAYPLPPIPNELVQGGRSLPHLTCGLQLNVVDDEDLFVRGDVNRDREVNLSDAIELVLYLYSARRDSLPCRDAADSDDNGKLNLTDALVLLRHLFLSGPPPRSPYPFAGKDPVDAEDPLPCEATD